MELALGATGGRLLRRIQRLVAPGSVEGTETSRWFAGVLVLVAVAVVGTGARLVNAEVAPPNDWGTPNEHLSVVSANVDQERSAPPDTVIMYRGEGTLDTRWRWAESRAQEERFENFWIGYAVAGDTDRGWLYFNRHTPIRFDGGSTMMGRMRIREPANMQFTGTRLDTVLPGHAASDVIILLGFSRRGGRIVLDRVHAGNFVFPVDFSNRAVLWLGKSDDRSSISLVQRVLGDAPSRQLREDVASLVAVHASSDLVRPVLTRWIESEEDDELRAEVADWLGYHADARTLGVLARAARSDRSSRVRSEAAETVGEVELDAAFDTLRVLAQTLEDEDARREAVEGFGHNARRETVDVLKEIAQRDRSRDIQREAVETLGELETAAALDAVAEVARAHESPDVRREAIEAYGEHAELEQAIRFLRRIIDEDRDVDLQREAVESLGEREDPRVIEMLATIAESHREEDVQRQATESLGHAAPVREARQALQRIVRSHRNDAVRKEALETLIDLMPEDSASTFFENVVQGENSTSMKVAALEALAEMKGEAALNAIMEAARSHPDRTVRRKAIELLGESDDPRAQAMLERILTRP
jgi:HEAT repeat protein